MADYFELDSKTEEIIRDVVETAKEKGHTVRFEVYDGWQREDGLGGRHFDINPDDPEWNDYFPEDDYLSTPEYDRDGCSDLSIVTDKDTHYIWYQDNEEDRVYVDKATKYLETYAPEKLIKENEYILDQLYEKLLGEYKDFINHLETLPPKEIIEYSYEKVFKEEFVYIFESIELKETTNIEYGEISIEHAKSLLSEEKPLEFLYKAWMDKEESYMDRLRDCVEQAVTGLAPKDKSLDSLIDNIINSNQKQTKCTLNKEKDTELDH